MHIEMHWYIVQAALQSGRSAERLFAEDASVREAVNVPYAHVRHLL